MSKYEPLQKFLSSQNADEVPMTFVEIERVLGAKLPNSKSSRAWWSNNPGNNVMTRAWLGAHYVAEKVDVKKGRLVFRRIESVPTASSAAEGFPKKKIYSDEVMKSGIHPLIGWMKGTITVTEGVDLTEPADPEWGNIAYGDDPVEPDR